MASVNINVQTLLQKETPEGAENKLRKSALRYLSYITELHLKIQICYQKQAEVMVEAAGPTDTASEK